MTETSAALAITDHNERGKTKAFAALYRFRNAVDVHQLFDQLFAAVARATTIATRAIIIVTTATVVAAAGTTTTTTAATAWTTSTGRICRGCVGCRSAGYFNFISHLELQSACARTIGERLDATVEQEPATIENNLGNARLFGALGNSFAH